MVKSNVYGFSGGSYSSATEDSGLNKWKRHTIKLDRSNKNQVQLNTICFNLAKFWLSVFIFGFLVFLCSCYFLVLNHHLEKCYLFAYETSLYEIESYVSKMSNFLLSFQNQFKVADMHSIKRLESLWIFLMFFAVTQHLKTITCHV